MTEVCFELEQSAAEDSVRQSPDFAELLMVIHTHLYGSPGTELVTTATASLQSAARQGQAAGAN